MTAQENAVQGTVVKPEMLQTSIWMKLNTPAYMCREDCAVLGDNGAIRPPTLFSHQLVYPAGGAACVQMSLACSQAQAYRHCVLLCHL